MKEIDHTELLQKTVECKEWSGSILTRVFNKTGVQGFELGSLGSAGFLKYKDRYFLVTASHVLSLVSEEKRLTDVVIPYQYGVETRSLTFIKHVEDKDSDIAVFEIEPQSALFMEQGNRKCFLDYTFIDEDPLGYFEKISNVVFLHGIDRKSVV